MSDMTLAEKNKWWKKALKGQELTSSGRRVSKTRERKTSLGVGGNDYFVQKVPRNARRNR